MRSGAILRSDSRSGSKNDIDLPIENQMFTYFISKDLFDLIQPARRI
jgi:hypothetical protein